MKKLIKLEKDKELVIDNQIYDYVDPTCIYIPINDEDNLKIGDYVYKNTYLNNCFTSVSGKLEEFREQDNLKYIKIINDYKENTLNKNNKKEIKSKEDLLIYLDLFHLNNIIKKIKKKDKIETIILSSIDEECYSLSEFMILANFFNEILETLNYLMEIFKVKDGIIATKNTDSNAIKNVRSILGTYPNIKISLLPDRYLISYEDNLCEQLHINKDNALIFTSQELIDLYYALIKAKINNSLFLSISGNNLVKSMIINTRIGTNLKEIVDKFLELKTNDYDIYINGLLKGMKVNNLEDVIILNNIHTIIINKKKNKGVDECINCGACYKICPVNIDVLKCYKNKRLSKKCLGCGLCNYICPANINLKEVVKDGVYEEKNN